MKRIKKRRSDERYKRGGGKVERGGERKGGRGRGRRREGKEERGVEGEGGGEDHSRG